MYLLLGWTGIRIDALLTQPDLHNSPLWQQLGSYVAEVDIETVDREISPSVGVCHCFSGDPVRCGHAEKAAGGLDGSDFGPVIEVGLQPARADCGGTDPPIL